MEYLNVCLSQNASASATTTSSATSPSLIDTSSILPFGGGGCTRVQFSSDSQHIYASGDFSYSASGGGGGGIKQWRVLPTLTTQEKRALQAEEERRQQHSASQHASLLASLESERAHTHAEKEKEKQRVFTQEMEKEKEKERTELEEERMSIQADGMDLLSTEEEKTNDSSTPAATATSTLIFGSIQPSPKSVLKSPRHELLPALKSNHSSAPTDRTSSPPTSSSLSPPTSSKTLVWLDQTTAATAAEDDERVTGSTPRTVATDLVTDAATEKQHHRRTGSNSSSSGGSSSKKKPSKHRRKKSQHENRIDENTTTAVDHADPPAASNTTTLPSLNRLPSLLPPSAATSSSTATAATSSTSSSTSQRPTFLRSKSKHSLLTQKISYPMIHVVESGGGGSGSGSGGAATARLPSTSTSTKEKDKESTHNNKSKHSGASTTRERGERGHDRNTTTYEAKTTVSLQAELRTKVIVDASQRTTTTTTTTSSQIAVAVGVSTSTSSSSTTMTEEANSGSTTKRERKRNKQQQQQQQNKRVSPVTSDDSSAADALRVALERYTSKENTNNQASSGTTSSTSRRDKTTASRRRRDSDESPPTSTGKALSIMINASDSTIGGSDTPSSKSSSKNSSRRSSLSLRVGAGAAGGGGRSSMALSPRNGGGGSNNNIMSPLSSSSASLITSSLPFSYCPSTEFPSDSSTYQLRVPCKTHPTMSRVLPEEEMFYEENVPGGGGGNSTAGGGIFALNPSDETMLVTIKRIEVLNGALIPCKKLVFFDRLKGRAYVNDKSHFNAASCITLSPDGKRCIVGTLQGHAYYHTLDQLTRWNYLWFKLKETDDPRPNLDLQYSPDGLAVLVSRACHQAPLTIWNAKQLSSSSGSQIKLLANLDGGSSLMNETLGHTSSSVKGVWTSDSECIVSLGWSSSDRTLRIWKNVMKSSQPRHVVIGRLNTPYTYVKTSVLGWDGNSTTSSASTSSSAASSHTSSTTPFFSHALCLNSSNTLIACSIGLTIFIIHLERHKCLQYITLWDLMSQEEAKREEELSHTWIDPYVMYSVYLSPGMIMQAHQMLPQLMLPDEGIEKEEREQAEKDAAEKAAAAASTTSTISITSPLTSPTSAQQQQQQQQPSFNKRSSLTRNQQLLDVSSTGLNSFTNKRGSTMMLNLSSPSNATNANNLSIAQPSPTNKRASMQMNRRGSLTRTSTLTASSSTSNTTTNASSSQQQQSLPPPPLERTSFFHTSSDTSFTSPSHSPAILTYITTLCFNSASTSLAIGTSIGGVYTMDLTQKVQRGEEDRENSDCILVPLRRAKQKLKYKQEEKTRELQRQQEQERKRIADAAEAERNRERDAHRERAREREARRIAREEARRLKLYVGNLPDLNYTPAATKIIAIEPFFREAYNTELLAAVEEKGDFLVRLEEDVAERKKKQEEREMKRDEEELAILNRANNRHGGSNLNTQEKEAKLSSFMARLNRDLSKRKDFRVTADKGEYYKKNSIVPKKMNGTASITSLLTLPVLR